MAYIGTQQASGIILEGLHRLEYRGYDSSGISILNGESVHTLRRVGKLAALDSALKSNALRGTVGIGHTRWATHGMPCEANAHPHCDSSKRFSVVHNGIIENYRALRKDLVAKGATFTSETDSEALAHLIADHYRGNLLSAVKDALAKVEGAYALAVVTTEDPSVIVGARRGSPLVIGVGNGENFLASDVAPLINHTRQVVFLEEGQICELHQDGYSVCDLDGVACKTSVETIEFDQTQAEKDGYPHFMLKEIHQQPQVIRDVLRSRVDTASCEIDIPGLGLSDKELRDCTRIVIVACGTAWHAGLIGKHYIERFARVPVEIDIASEFRYRDPIIEPGSIVMPVSQSGETADTLEALRVAKRKGAKVVSVINVMGSSITRESHGVIPINAGPEIGVASTKAYTSQIVAFAVFAIYLGLLRKTLSKKQAQEYLIHLQGVPDKMQQCLDNQETIMRCANDPKYRDPQSAFFMGRGYNFPSALEGALKLKEISYIHAEGYPAGEMKHGPIALITDRVPMVCISTDGLVYQKVLSNVHEIRARSGRILVIATEGNEEVGEYCDDVIHVPQCFEPFSPILVAVPLQLLSYHIGVNRGCDVDQPRNLAKSVTVE